MNASPYGDSFIPSVARDRRHCAPASCASGARLCVCLALERSSHPSLHAAQDRLCAYGATASNRMSPGHSVVKPRGFSPGLHSSFINKLVSDGVLREPDSLVCLSRFRAIQPSFAACGSGPPLRLWRNGVQPNVPRTFGCQTTRVLTLISPPNKRARNGPVYLAEREGFEPSIQLNTV